MVSAVRDDVVNGATKKPWVKAEHSSRVFTARLPGDLEAGTHCIAVRAVDEYGREYRDHLVLELTASDKPTTHQQD
jgi:hypothetical protein